MSGFEPKYDQTSAVDRRARELYGVNARLGDNNSVQKRETELAHGQCAKWNQVRDPKNKLTDCKDPKERAKMFKQSNIFGTNFDKDQDC